MRPEVPSPRDKLVLDERAFQLLLAAAYALQAQNDRLPRKEAEANRDHVQSLSDGRIKLPEKDVLVPAGSEPVHLTRPLHRRRPAGARFPLSDELFWNVSIAVTIAAVSTLLLGASMHRFSPLPGVSQPSEVGQKLMPFQGTIRSMASSAPSAGSATHVSVRTAGATSSAAAVKNLTSPSRVNLASAQTKMVKKHRSNAIHSRQT